jgi:DNA-binding NtrC family response regulator
MNKPLEKEITIAADVQRVLDHIVSEEPMPNALATVERELLRQTLHRTGWNVTRAARILGVSRDTLRYRIDKYGLREQ